MEPDDDAGKGGLGLGNGGRRDAVEIDPFARELLGSGKEEEIARHPAHFLGLAADRLQMLGRAPGRSQREIGEPVDRGGGVAELVRGAGRDLAEFGKVPRQRHPRLELPHLGQVGEEREHPEEPAIGAFGRRHGDAEGSGLSGRDPPDLPAPDGLALGEHLADRVAELRDRLERLLVTPAVQVSGELEDLLPRFVQLVVGFVRGHREDAGRQISREKSRPGLEVVGARLELALLLFESRDRGLETLDQELALVARFGVSSRDRRDRKRSPIRRGEEAVVRREQRAQVEAGEHHERGAGDRDDQRE